MAKNSPFFGLESGPEMLLEKGIFAAAAKARPGNGDKQARGYNELEIS